MVFAPMATPTATLAAMSAAAAAALAFASRVAEIRVLLLASAACSTHPVCQMAARGLLVSVAQQVSRF